jgi:hypothetical protein
MLSPVLYILGIFCALLGFFIALRRQRWLGTTAVATGTIVGVDERANASGTVRAFPIIRYEADGRTFDYRSPVPLPGPGLDRIGRTVPIRYLQDDPGRARIDSPLSVWLAPALFVVLGVGLVLAGRFFV